jgi:hypothetical protein
VLQLFLNLRFQHCTERVFVRAVQQFVTPIRKPGLFDSYIKQ